MYFLIKNDDLLEKYDTIWDKVIVDIKKEFDSEPVYIKKILKTKIESHDDKVINFNKKKVGGRFQSYLFNCNQHRFCSQ